MQHVICIHISSYGWSFFLYFTFNLVFPVPHQGYVMFFTLFGYFWNYYPRLRFFLLQYQTCNYSSFAFAHFVHHFDDLFPISLIRYHGFNTCALFLCMWTSSFYYIKFITYTETLFYFVSHLKIENTYLKVRGTITIHNILYTPKRLYDVW